jgi:PEP-CTERM motif
MRHTSVLITAVLAALLITPMASASPILDQYFIETANFPGTIFPATVPLTFNATGDLTPEVVPGSNGDLEVVEQVMGIIASGDLALRFEFDLLRTPPDNLFAGFAFRIRDLDFNVSMLGFTQSFLQIIFETTTIGPIDATMFVTPSLEADGGLTLLFQTPPGVEWIDIFGTAQPTSVQVNFFAAVDIPEPSTLLNLAVGLLAAIGLRRRR